METYDIVLDVCEKFGCAVLLSGLIGLERERKGRSAGLRTHILVCLGATLAIVVSDLLAREWAASGTSVWLDKGRIAAGVITGVGFLGAGAIINVGNIHRGLTTAATIWFVAALGIAVGLGFFLVAACATGFALVVVVCLRYLEGLLSSEWNLKLEMRAHGGIGIVDEIEKALESQGYSLTASRLRASGEDDRVDMTFELSSRERLRLEDLAQVLQERFPSIQRIIFER